MLGRTRFITQRASTLPLVSFSNKLSSDVSEPKKGKLSSFLSERTGETGAGVLALGLVATGVSKEMIVLDADVIAGSSLFICTALMAKKASPAIVKALDNRAKAIHNTMSEGKQIQLAAYESAIAEEKEAAASLEAASEIFDIKRVSNLENQLTLTRKRESNGELMQEERERRYLMISLQELVQIELETEYRRRIKQVHQEVKKRLDYQVELENAKKAFIRDHIINWLEKEVVSSITAEQEEANINQCIANLSLLAPQ